MPQEPGLCRVQGVWERGGEGSACQVGTGLAPPPWNRHLDRACLVLELSGLRENMKKQSCSSHNYKDPS